MKSLFFFGLICVVSAGLPASIRRRPFNTINDQIIEFLHRERENFPCGWPDSGLNPVEPFLVEEYQIVLDSATELTTIDFLLTNAQLTGQKNMWINDLDFDVTSLKISFDINVAELLIIGDHRTSASLLQGIITVPVSGEGRINMAVNNARVIGSGQLVTLPGGFLQLTQFVITLQVGTVNAQLTGFGALDGAVSTLFSSVAPEMVNSSQERINEIFAAVMVPGLNKFLNQHTLTTFLGLVTSRNGNPPPRRCFL